MLVEWKVCVTHTLMQLFFTRCHVIVSFAIKIQFDLPKITMQKYPWVVPLRTTLPKSRESWTQFFLKIPSTYTLVYFIGLGGLCFPHLCTHS
jgi:hypothetical protein